MPVLSESKPSNEIILGSKMMLSPVQTSFDGKYRPGIFQLWTMGKVPIKMRILMIITLDTTSLTTVSGT